MKSVLPNCKEGSTFYAPNYEKWKEALKYGVPLPELQKIYQKVMFPIELWEKILPFMQGREVIPEKIKERMEFTTETVRKLEEQSRQAREDAERILEEREYTNRKVRELEAENKCLHEQLLIQQSYAAGAAEGT